MSTRSQGGAEGEIAGFSDEATLVEDARSSADEAELSPKLASLLEAAGEASTAAAHDAAKLAPPQLPALCLATVIQVDDMSVELRVGAEVVSAKLVHVHRAVMQTACERGEPVLVQRQPDGSYWVAGALRTQPTPGVDAIDEIELDAKRIRLRASEEITMEAASTRPGEASTTARLALRAAGEIETYATRILSKAEEVHKLVGRMLRIN